MEENQSNREKILEKLQQIEAQQSILAKEIKALKSAIKQENSPTAAPESELPEKPSPDLSPKSENQENEAAAEPEKEMAQPASTQQVQSTPAKPQTYEPKPKFQLEKFIGENLLNKIGILIMVVGVMIGIKYAIDNQMATPLVRIILGYLSGGALLAFALRIKQKYESFSAVLLSGGMAILYFVSFSAYYIYGFIPQWFAFLLMLVFTAFTTLAAMKYNQVLIALLGMVGAYGIPFLLGDDSGNVVVLLSYIFIINLGVLWLVLNRNWKALLVTAFVVSWAILSIWTVGSSADEFGIAQLFLLLFFLKFYIAFTHYGFFGMTKEAIKLDVLFLITNALLFFSLGYYLIDQYLGEDLYLTLYVVFNAFLHFAAVIYLKYSPKIDKTYFYLSIIKVITFITLAIPIYFEGKWITVFWAAEAILLFGVGRSKKISVFEQISQPVFVLTFLSLVLDWERSHYRYSLDDLRPIPFLSAYFLNNLLIASAFGGMLFWHQKTKAIFSKIKDWFPFLMFGLFLTVAYQTFWQELDLLWEILYQDSRRSIPVSGESPGMAVVNSRLSVFRTLSLYYYTFAFLAIWAYFTIKRNFHFLVKIINTIVLAMTLLLFLLEVNKNHFNLLEYARDAQLILYYGSSPWSHAIRIFSYLFLFMGVFSLRNLALDLRNSGFMQKAVELMVYLIALLVLLAEVRLLGIWMDSATFGKWAVTAILAVYALMLVIIGFWKKKAHLRQLAIVLLAITLLKLIFNDIAHLSTISITLVLVFLGVLLLLVSFLYNKFKGRLLDE